MKRIYLISLATLFAASLAFSQGAAINSNGAPADNSALLDLSSTSQGMLVTRMTTSQMNSIQSPARGLFVYNLDCDNFNYYNGSVWVPFGNNGSIASPGSISGNTSPCENSGPTAYSVSSVPGATAYNWSVPSGSVIAAGQGTTDITVNFDTVSGNICVTAFNACGSGNATCLTISLQLQPNAPSAATHSASGSQIIWNWNVVSGASGYKWNSINDYNSAVDLGSATNNTETGLTCNTDYTSYVWSYNSCGPSANTTLTQNSGRETGTGGTITYTDASGLNPRSSPPYPGGYAVHTFTSPGTFTPAACTGSIEVLVAGGGGGGGCDNGGGGGAGGVVYNSSYSVVPGNNYTVTVGNGGAGAASYWSSGVSGNPSAFDAVTANGGGGGASLHTNTGTNGGSGGGGAPDATGSGTYPGGTGTPGQGNNGGSGGTGSPRFGGGGGGGAGSAGSDGVSNNGGNGGDGLTYMNTTLGGGGGGGANNATKGYGGAGGGGNGANSSNDSPTAGAANTGGGGGGGGGAFAAGPGAAGGSGIVIVRYAFPAP